MKKKSITVPYIHGLASYLDTVNIEFYNPDDGNITIYYTDEKQALKIAFEFSKWYEKYVVNAD